MVCEFPGIHQVVALEGKGTPLKDGVCREWANNVCKTVTAFSNNLRDIKQSEAKHILFPVLMDLAQLVREGTGGILRIFSFLESVSNVMLMITVGTNIRQTFILL